MIPVIGIHGAIAAGKDTLADMLREYDPKRFQRYSMAAPLKAIGAVMGFTAEQMADHTLKETVDPFWNITPRRFLQLVGTEMFREEFRQDVWIKMAQRQLIEANRNGMILVISDIRFADEAAFVQNAGGRLYHILRPGSGQVSMEVAAHRSEGGIPEALRGVPVMNDGTLDQLRAKAYRLAGEALR